MRGLVLALAMIATVAALAGSKATAANTPHPTLDAVASEVAGKPVAVWCESSEGEWDARTAAFGLRGFQVQSYTLESVIYLSPSFCMTLRDALNAGRRDAGPYWLSGALLALLHEAQHQRGVLDEGEADCAALGLVRATALRHFGFKATMTVRRIVRGTKKIRGVRVPWARVKTARRPDPDLARLVELATAWHRAKPPEYQGTC